MDDNVSNVDLLDQRELIHMVKYNPPLYAKSTKEYCGKGYDKDLAWQTVGSTMWDLSGQEASREFYNIRQRFGRKRRKALTSLKVKSDQGAVIPYVPLADHIVARKTSSSYSSASSNTEPAAVIKPANLTIETQPLIFHQLSPMFAQPSLSPSLSLSPSVYRETSSSQKTSGSMCSSDCDMFFGNITDTDSQTSTGQSPVVNANLAEVKQEIKQVCSILLKSLSRHILYCQMK